MRKLSSIIEEKERVGKKVLQLRQETLIKINECEEVYSLSFIFIKMYWRLFQSKRVPAVAPFSSFSFVYPILHWVTKHFVCWV